MNCDKYKELISAQLDGEISAEEEKELNEHMAKCSDCSDFAASLKDIIELSAKRNNVSMPIDLEQSILGKTAKKKRSLLEHLTGYYRVPKFAIWAGVAFLGFFAVNTYQIRTEPVMTSSGISNKLPSASLTTI